MTVEGRRDFLTRLRSDLRTKRLERFQNIYLFFPSKL
jgi:hypothetical protein